MNFQRQAKLDRDRKALMVADAARAKKAQAGILKRWEGLGKETGESSLGFFIWAGRTIGYPTMFKIFDQAKAGGLYGAEAFSFVKQTIYSRLRDTA